MTSPPPRHPAQGGGRAQLLDGRVAAAALKRELAGQVEQLVAAGRRPGLATVLVGDDAPSHTYVRMKHQDCDEVGVTPFGRQLPAEVSQRELEGTLDELNADPSVHGILVQLPLPSHLDTTAVLKRIAPAKDADGLHPMNLGALVLAVNEPLSGPVPCTPAGVVALAAHYGVPWEGRHVVVVGRGTTVGRPLGLLLGRRELNATVTTAHSGTADLTGLLQTADIIVSAVGSAHLITPEKVKQGAVVFDVGVSRVPDPHTGQLVLAGDVHPEVAEVASWLTPNPGGVGPMTRALLLRNVVQAAAVGEGVGQ